MVQLWGFILDNGNIEQISNVLETYKEYEPQDGNVDIYSELEERIATNTGQYEQVNQEINLPLHVAAYTTGFYKYGLLGLAALLIGIGGYKMGQWIKDLLWDKKPLQPENSALTSLESNVTANELWYYDHNTSHFGGEKFGRNIIDYLDRNVSICKVVNDLDMLSFLPIYLLIVLVKSVAKILI